MLLVDRAPTPGETRFPQETAGPDNDVPRWMWVRPLAMFALARVVVAVVWWDRAAPRRWDSWWYSTIVAHGYRPVPGGGQSNIAFFPLFPAVSAGLGRIIDAVSGSRHGSNAQISLTIVALAAGGAATVLFWAFTRELFDQRVADRATALFAVAPGSFALSLLYSEGVFLLLAIAACCALWHRRWVVAGVASLLAGLARPTGIVLTFVCLVAAFSELAGRRSSRDPSGERDRRVLLAPALAPLGWLGFHAYLWQRTGSATAWFDVQRTGWHEQSGSLGSRLDEIGGTMRSLTGPVEWIAVVNTVGLVVVVAGLVLLSRRRLPVVLVAYTACTAVLTLTSASIGFRPRMVLVIFPLFMVFGERLRTSRWFWLVLAMSTGMLVAISATVAHTNVLVP